MGDLICQVCWIDCHGNVTEDNNPAVGYAIVHWPSGDYNRFMVCEEHIKNVIDRQTVHHDKDCKHYSRFYKDGGTWTFQPFGVVA